MFIEQKRDSANRSVKERFGRCDQTRERIVLQYTIIRCVMMMALCAALVYPFVSHLTEAQERQRREEFGSSLKRLKWDEKEQKAVETRNGADRADSGEVIRVETSLAVFDIPPLGTEGRPVP